MFHRVIEKLRHGVYLKLLLSGRKQCAMKILLVVSLGLSSEQE